MYYLTEAQLALSVASKTRGCKQTKVCPSPCEVDSNQLQENEQSYIDCVRVL